MHWSAITQCSCFNGFWTPPTPPNPTPRLCADRAVLSLSSLFSFPILAIIFRSVVLLASKEFELFGFQNFWLWASLVRVIPGKRRAHYIIILLLVSMVITCIWWSQESMWMSKQREKRNVQMGQFKTKTIPYNLIEEIFKHIVWNVYCKVDSSR